MSILDSRAVFKARVEELGLPWPVFEKRSWTTHGIFAFAANYIPGNSDDKAFWEGIVRKLEFEEDSPLVPCVRRLFCESYTFAAGELRSRLDRGSDDPPRKMPAAERALRLEALKNRLPGLDFEGETEPSIHLIELAANMVDSGAVRYLGWELCTSRYQELCATRKDRTWRPDSHGHLREHDQVILPQADVASDLKLMNALRRRGVALDIGLVLSFEQHECIVKWLFKSLAREPPAGYARVSFDQLALADKELWRLVAEQTRGGLAVRADGKKALDNIVPELLRDATLSMMLMPLPSSSRHVTGSGSIGAGAANHAGVKRPAVSIVTPRSAKRKKVQAPVAFKDLPTKTTDGRPICFSFNLPNGCSEAKPGDKCKRGIHICPRCFANHSLTQCPAAHKST